MKDIYTRTPEKKGRVSIAKPMDYDDERDARAEIDFNRSARCMFEKDVLSIIEKNKLHYETILSELEKLSKYEKNTILSKKITVKGRGNTKKTKTIRTLDKNYKLLIESLFVVANVDAALAESGFSWHTLINGLRLNKIPKSD